MIVTLRVDGAGRFSSGPLAGGRWALRIEATGYRAVETSLNVPHGGEWSNVEARLQSLRALAAGAYRPVALAMLPHARLWGLWTGRETLDHAERHERLPSGAPKLWERVEHACYGWKSPLPSEVGEIEGQARAVLDDLAGASPLGRSAHGPRSRH